ncbi:hypothetical protein D3C86_1391550 [compost metagenome]
MVVGEQLVQTGYHRQRRPGLQCSQVGTVESIALDESCDPFQAFFADQRTAVAHIDVAVVAQQNRLGQRADTLQGFENVAPVSGGDVDDAHLASPVAQLLHGQAQQLFDMQLALANAAPADGVQVIAVDHAAETGCTGGRVAVDVVQGAAGVEPGVEPQLDPR